MNFLYFALSLLCLIAAVLFIYFACVDRKFEVVVDLIAAACFISVSIYFCVYAAGMESEYKTNKLVPGHTYVITDEPFEDPFQPLETDTVYVEKVKDGYALCKLYKFKEAPAQSYPEWVLLDYHTYTDITMALQDKELNDLVEKRNKSLMNATKLYYK